MWQHDLKCEALLRGEKRDAKKTGGYGVGCRAFSCAERLTGVGRGIGITMAATSTVGERNRLAYRLARGDWVNPTHLEERFELRCTATAPSILRKEVRGLAKGLLGSRE